MIKLLKRSDLSDLECKDGEVENADYLFETDNSAGSAGDNSSAEDTVLKLRLAASTALNLPAGAAFLCMHRPTDDAPHAVVRLISGHLAYSSPAWSTFTASPVGNVVKACAVGDILVVLTADALLYFRWTGRGYVREDAAASTEAQIEASPVALPPYTYLPSDYPSVSVAVGIGGDSSTDVLNWLAGFTSSCSASTQTYVLEAVRQAATAFVKAVASAGLFISPVRAAVCRRLDDGTLWQPSAALYLSPERSGGTPAPDSPLTASIVSASCSGGTLFMTLRFSRRPFEVTQVDADSALKLLVSANVSDINTYAVSQPVYLSSSVRGFQFATLPVGEDDYAPFEDVRPTITDIGIPDDIFSIGGRLLCLWRQGRSRESNMVATSMAAWPQISAGVSQIYGGTILHLAHSLRSVSAAQFGQAPLIAFCSDGVRALTPDSGAFRDVQLISRDVALGLGSFAPLADGTCFITAAGVMRIKGTTVSNLSKSLDRELDAEDRPVAIYSDSCVVVYRPGDARAAVCDLISGKWTEAEVEGVIADHRYSWPEAWVRMEGAVGILTLVREPAAGAGRSAVAPPDVSELPVSVRTRPLKLGDPFAVKQMLRIEGAWPDGSRWPVKVYGAMQLGKWHFLGLGQNGAMRMRGSGWRYFRIVTFVPRSGGKYLLPVFRLITKNC